jgi:hypothetical protein
MLNDTALAMNRTIINRLKGSTKGNLLSEITALIEELQWMGNSPAVSLYDFRRIIKKKDRLIDKFCKRTPPRHPNWGFYQGLLHEALGIFVYHNGEYVEMPSKPE